MTYLNIIMTLEVTVLYKTALLFMGLNSIACSVTTLNDLTQTSSKYESTRTEESKPFQSATTTSQPPQKYKRTASTDIKPDPNYLSPEIFPTEIIDLLSPEMLSQPDPVPYFLEKISGLQYQNMLTIRSYLMALLKYQRDAFPKHYVPYARVLWNLLNCQYFLELVKRAIVSMPPSTASVQASRLALFSPQLTEFFSPDIFGDDKPPSRLIIKLANTHSLTDKIPSFRAELRDVFSNNKLPEEYRRYSTAMDLFFKNVNVSQALEVSIVAFRSINSRIPFTAS